MTLEKTLRQQLSNPEPGEFLVSHGDWTIRLSVAKADSLSCALTEVRLERAAPIAEDLPAWAGRLAQSLTGLMEPLRLIEVDRPAGKALLRSTAPSVRDERAFYYELVLERSTLTRAVLKRHAGKSGGPRADVPFALTHDAVVKLVADIIGRN